MITFTIITCTYNAAEVLKRTLDSVLAQTYPRVEHIIIDGVSKDDTVAMANEYKQKSDNNASKHKVTVLSEEDNGLYDAMNKGIHLATGDYILFLNAGDTFPNNDTLYTIANTANEDNTLPGVLYGETDIVDDSGAFVRHRRLKAPSKLSWHSFKYGMLVCHQAFYARTDVAKRTPYNTQFRYSADVDWCIRVLKEAELKQLPISNVNAIIVNYLAGGMTNVYHRASLRERVIVMSLHYGYTTTVLMHIWFIIRAILLK